MADVAAKSFSVAQSDVPVEDHPVFRMGHRWRTTAAGPGDQIDDMRPIAPAYDLKPMFTGIARDSRQRLNIQ